ncbi:hypothetical protein Tco_0537387 [Tanacetum coccineum]
MSDMTACLNDLSYIPLNNDQNEPTQGDIGETSNDPTQVKRNEFEELYVSANEELYPGCDYVTRLDFMAKFTYFKVKGKLTDSIFNEMLEFFQNVFPIAKGYKLPPSYYAIKKIFKMIGLGYELIHACVKDCFLFQGDANKDVHFCLVCNTSRWKDSNTPGKKVPKKVLRYFPIIPRLQRLYKSSHTAKEMTWHATGKCTEPGKMQHPVDGRAWKDFDTKYPDFAAEPRNVRLGLAADGFNQFGNLSQSYSMCSKSPGKDIDVYLRPLIDDLMDLWAKPGVETIDVATCLKFNMRAMKPHKWRRSLEFNGKTEDGDPPREFSRDAIMTQLARLTTRVKGKHPRFGGVKIKRNVLVELNWTKRSIFYELEYWYFLTLKYNLEVMHIEKNVLESILNTLLMNDKSKDTAKARQDLKRLGIRSGLWLSQNKNEKCLKSQAAYSFTPENKKKFCQFIKGVKLPDGFGSNFKHKVTDNDTNITGLKSHHSQRKVIDILCNLELIYPPDFFDIMIHLVIYLPLEAIFGGPIRPRWMYPFERYLKKLKNYVRNKAKPEGSIAEGYVAEEALTFSSHYFRDVTTKFNRPDRNVDCPPPTCQFQVFKSLCKSIGLRSVIRIDHQELKKVIWYVLHNSPEIDTYRAKFKSEFPNKDMKEEFPGWFGKQTITNSNLSQLNGVRFVVHSRDERHTTQNSGICSSGPDGEMYYGQLEQILTFSYLSLKTVLFQVKWFATSNKGHIIDVDEDDDIIDEEDSIPHVLADSDDEDLVNLDIDNGVNVMSADVARGHDGDGGGKGTRKPNLGDRRAGRMHTRQETQNLMLKAITDKNGPVPIKFKFGDRDNLMPLDDHAVHWSNYLKELVRELPLHYPSWHQMPSERKAGVVAKIGTQFDLGPHMEFDRWPQIYEGIQQHLQKIYNGKKVALKERYWVPDSDIAFWNDPKNHARATRNKQNRAKRKVVCRQGSRSIAALRDMHKESSATREYPSLIYTFFLTHTVNGVFLNPEDKALYEEMLRLQGLGSNTETGVPYTEDEIMAIVCWSKQRGHIPGVGRVFPEQGTVIPPPPPCTHSSDVVKLKKRENVLTHHVNMFMKLFRSDDKFSQMLTQLESQPEIGGGSGSGERGDDEQGDDEDDGEDGEDKDDRVTGHKKLEAEIPGIVTSPSCKQESEVHTMSRLTFVIDDGTGSIHGTILTPDVINKEMHGGI